MSSMTVNITYTDGESIETDITMADRVRFDITRPRQKWPDAQEAPFLALSFWAWAALARQKKTEINFDDWYLTVSDIERLEDDDIEDQADPTPATPSPTD
ncbi:hypothetical protein ACL1G7_13190 [Corynebacterium striatum]